jgi:hypothetical protein
MANVASGSSVPKHCLRVQALQPVDAAAQNRSLWSSIGYENTFCFVIRTYARWHNQVPQHSWMVPQYLSRFQSKQRPAPLFDKRVARSSATRFVLDKRSQTSDRYLLFLRDKLLLCMECVPLQNRLHTRLQGEGAHVRKLHHILRWTWR